MGRPVNACSKAAAAAHVLANLLATDGGEQRWRRSSDQIFQFIENQGVFVTPFPYFPGFRSRKGLTFVSALDGLSRGFCFGPPPRVLYRSDLDEASKKLVVLHEYFHLLNPNCRSTGNATTQTIMATLAQGLVPEASPPETFKKRHDIEGPCNLFARCTLMPEPIFS